MTRVDQVLGSAAPFDATNTQAGLYRELLASRGIEGEVYAAEVGPGGHAAPLSRLANRRRDLLIVHYSGFVPGMRAVLELPGPMMLVYHNITPARYFWNVQPYVATICQLGRDSLALWARSARLCAAVSAFNAAELRAAGAIEPAITPILVDPRRLDAVGTWADVPRGRPLVLAVGRLSPHKRHDHVLRAFALFQRRHAPDAALLCVGAALDRPYRRRLDQIAAESGARNVTFAEHVAQPELNAAYAEADVLLSMSEHEGFCVPLLEAFHFGVPVVARRAAAMPEVAEVAALWVEQGEDLSVVAELLRVATSDDEVRSVLAGRGRARLSALSFERSSAAVETAIRGALAGTCSQSKDADDSSTSRREDLSGPGAVRAIS